MIGSFCYRFKDAAHAQAMIATLDGEAVVDWGPHYKQTGTDREGNATYTADPGHLVFVLTGDLLGVDGWERWQFVPDPWPHSFGGRMIDQLACEELAPAAPAKIPEDVPAKLTKEEKEAKADARQAEIEKVKPLLDARAEQEKSKDEQEAIDKAIRDAPKIKQKLADTITDARAKLAALEDADKIAQLTERIAYWQAQHDGMDAAVESLKQDKADKAQVKTAADAKLAAERAKKTKNASGIKR